MEQFLSGIILSTLSAVFILSTFKLAILAKLLIDGAVDVNTKNNSNVTPLHNLYGKLTKEIAELFIAQGGNINASSNQNFTPLHYAIARISLNYSSSVVLS
ncbi:hypothetical protein NIES37_59360 [Tolypothrix tenuis PCC 7101]|uniref:Uncharacterized protein n=1 Tax=Tolypothrix tenuis PCC 7101 TaxID=231146 RepID=A0A1Z4N875_9CYAN|nr:ankyrin repeat domain-containing protein [Aulosira sp. FACHB-113]BAY34769.1 hypothetical protein NIES2107_66760 [Nostoc carneum NIES-2107]BAZ01929.1 hypothetical protein NIES37_59360 [Tolypothrix tenuis PCC 7101]BAZ74146.1 hypothetical protein NIES50_27170 [Aulosira laxa NIES-50]